MTFVNEDKYQLGTSDIKFLLRQKVLFGSQYQCIGIVTFPRPKQGRWTITSFCEVIKWKRNFWTFSTSQWMNDYHHEGSN